MVETIENRRLCAIVSVDIAGYSALTEADEAAAVRLVSELAARVEEAAAVHGGRVFNTAGDGFMLEFPTVSGALAAAQEVLDPSVRIGLHLGEIAVTPTGDLLGHGVNVAARLQGLARPGEILVSDDARRALRGPPAGSLVSRGRVRLDKMSETAEVFAVGPPLTGPAHPPPAWRPKPRLSAAGAVVLLLVAAFGGWLLFRGSGPPAGPLRTAVVPISAPTGDAEAQAFARGLTDGIAGAIADQQAPTVSEEAARDRRRGGARLLVNGRVERTGENLLVRLRIDDARADLSLWTVTLERPAAEAGALQDQAAVRVADVVTRAVAKLRGYDRPVRAETLGALLKLAEYERLGRPRAPQFLQLARQIVRDEPNLSSGHADLAYALASLLNQNDRDLSRRYIGEATREARRALALDPHNGDAYDALLMLILPEDRVRRLAVIRDGLAAEPQNSTLIFDMANILRDAGRSLESERLFRLAVALDPMSAAKLSGAIYTLSAMGAAPEAETLSRRVMRLWPERPASRRAGLEAAMLYSSPDAALAMLEAFQAGSPAMIPPDADLWRAFAEARRAGRFQPELLAALRQGAEAGRFAPSSVVAAVALGGDVDGAYALVDYILDSHQQIYTSTLFEPAAAAMRRDPRFFPLMQRLGMIEFWRNTRVWPDFCTRPGEEQDCQAGAETAYRAARAERAEEPRT